MKWILVEVDRGKRHEMPTRYATREAAERDREIFLDVNPHKGCEIREVGE